MCVNCINKRERFLRIYGKDCWVINAGVNVGIGWVFCKDLAKRGLDVFLYYRNEVKLARTSVEIIKLFVWIQVRAVTKYFQKPTSVDFIKQFMHEFNI